MNKAILLDLDNTLYRYDPTHKVALSAVQIYCENQFAITPNDFSILFARAKKWVKNQQPASAASHHRLLYWQRLCEILQVNIFRHAMEMYDCYWNTFLSSMTLEDDAKAFLERYRKKKIIILTDLTSHIQYRKIAQLGIAEYLSGGMVTSEEAAHEKPHPYMFMLALHKLQINACEACVVGDNFEKDILGAQALNIPAFWIDRSAQRSKNKSRDPLETLTTHTVTRVELLSDIEIREES